MNRRNFLLGSAGLFLPYEPRRIYSIPSSNYLESLNMAKMLSLYGVITSSNINAQAYEAVHWKNYERNGFLNYISGNITGHYKNVTAGYYVKTETVHDPIWGDSCECSFCTGIDSEFRSTKRDARLIAWSKSERKAKNYPQY